MDQTVINIDGVPTRPTTEISSYVKRFPAHCSQSHPHHFFSPSPPQTAPRSKRSHHRSFAEGDANEIHHRRRLPRAALHSDCRCWRCGEWLWTLSLSPCFGPASASCPHPRGALTSRGVAERRLGPAGKHRSVSLITPGFPSIQMHPPLMDTVTVTAMLYQFVTAFGL